MALEISDRRVHGITGAAIPVYNQEVDLAAAALFDELGEPAETLGGRGVGDAGGAEFGGPARERLHVGVPAGDGVGGGDAGASPRDDYVGFVEAQEVAGSG